MLRQVHAVGQKGSAASSIAIDADGALAPLPGWIDKLLGIGISKINLVLMVASIPGSTPRFKHRGRIQAQGGGLEKSVPWASNTPPTSAQGQAMLVALRTQLSAKDARNRNFGFQRAERFINNAGQAGGVTAPVSRTFLTPGTKDIRIDIEIITGQAFVP